MVIKTFIRDQLKLQTKNEHKNETLNIRYIDKLYSLKK